MAKLVPVLPAQTWSPPESVTVTCDHCGQQVTELEFDSPSAVEKNGTTTRVRFDSKPPKLTPCGHRYGVTITY